MTPVSTFRFEESDRAHELFGLAQEFLGGRRHLLGCRCVLLDNLVELLHGLIDLAGPGVLFVAGGVYLLDEIGRPLDIRDDLFLHISCIFRYLDTVLANWLISPELPGSFRQAFAPRTPLPQSPFHVLQRGPPR